MKAVVACIVVALVACRAPTDERATEDGGVAHARCESCHVGDFEEASDPPHLDQLPTTCFVCHTQDDWSPARLSHDFYPLTGAHLSARCLGCHVARGDENEPRYEGTDGACVACHRDDYDHSPFPEHSTFATTCTDCHTTDAWRPARHPVDATTHATQEPHDEPPVPEPRPEPPPPAPHHPPRHPVHRPPHHPVPTPVETPQPRPDVRTHASRR